MLSHLLKNISCALNIILSFQFAVADGPSCASVFAISENLARAIQAHSAAPYFESV